MWGRSTAISRELSSPAPCWEMLRALDQSLRSRAVYFSTETIHGIWPFFSVRNSVGMTLAPDRLAFGRFRGQDQIQDHQRHWR